MHLLLFGACFKLKPEMRSDFCSRFNWVFALHADQWNFFDYLNSFAEEDDNKGKSIGWQYALNKIFAFLNSVASEYDDNILSLLFRPETRLVFFIYFGFQP